MNDIKKMSMIEIEQQLKSWRLARILNTVIILLILFLTLTKLNLNQFHILDFPIITILIIGYLLPLYMEHKTQQKINEKKKHERVLY